MRLAIVGGGFAAVLLVLLRLFAFAPYSIPSGSMQPTLEVGDYVAVETYAYGWSRYTPLVGALVPGARIFYQAPRRGDVVAFRTPGNLQEVFIKRVIGLPGDKVQLRDGIVYINDVAVPRTRISDYLDAEPGMPPVVRWRYTEMLPGGRSYEVLLLAGGAKPADATCDDPKRSTIDVENTCPFLVPSDHFFVLGDDRDNSADSRIRGGVVGMVPKENLIGRAALILFSWNGARGGPQFSRIGKSVR